MRLLVADDDPSLRLALRLVLEDTGHDVFEAGSVQGARDVLQSVHPDFVLIDAGMSQSGVTLWDELLADIRYHGRVLLLTGDLTTLGLLGRHKAVVSKPFDYDRLLHRIEKAGPRPGGGTLARDLGPGNGQPDDFLTSR